MKGIAVSECHSYDPEEVRESVTECIELLGGARRFASSGDRVLLKPNMLMAASPERHVTTHPSVIEAVAEVFLDLGAEVSIGDSPGGSFRNIERFWRATGILDVCRRLDIEPLNFEASGSYIMGSGYPISRPVVDSDLVVNLPKLKTHSMTIFTCAVKNMYGAVPGFGKADYHREHPRPSEFARRLLEIYLLTEPALTWLMGLSGWRETVHRGETPGTLESSWHQRMPLHLTYTSPGYWAWTPSGSLLMRPPGERDSPRILPNLKLQGMNLKGWMTSGGHQTSITPLTSYHRALHAPSGSSGGRDLP